MRLLNGLFWLDAAERGVRAAAATALGLLSGEGLGLLDVAWGSVASAAVLAAVANPLASVVASRTGDSTTAGFTTDSR
ncbi:Holin [Microtetraspora sp. AC03309]|uniref:holin n=1 Tax=Microtetraspora sp. AC03309 TaxID=2779376 RepID=UPI001E44D453|nr:holin [Microtetraspora sp. AC03309]MCC5581948.1 Holin [Microtetraspora sp. AC03309]